MRAALVITTYNNPRLLGICLKSFTNQTRDDFDIFVADDGSTRTTAEKIESFRPFFERRLHHVWHDDHGYDKTKINNDVFRQTHRYPVTICVDHDTIAHYRFVEDHLTLHERHENLLFMGRRVDLGPKITRSITEDNVLRFNRGITPALLLSGLRNDSRNVLRSVRITSPWMQRKLGRDRVKDLLGSNFSVSTELLHRVNGYNEDYKAYWGEDGDLFVRIRNSGATILGLKGYAVQYHLDHPRLEPSQEYVSRYQSLLKDTAYVECENGIRKPRADT